MSAAHAALPRRPPSRAEPELWQGLLPALIAHGGLVLALAFGVNWKSSPDTTALSAELWAAVPQAAAAPAPEPAPALQAQAVPAPSPAPVAAAPPPPPQNKAADIAVEAEKKPPARPTPNDAQRKAEEAAREAKAAREAREARDAREAREAREQAERQKQALERQREENLRRMLGQAAATGSGGVAAAEVGPSASYRGRLIAAIRPNIVFTDPIAGSPAAEVALRAGPDGNILSRQLSKPSGNAAWDEAVLRAIDRTQRLPRDVDGRVPASLVIVFRPSDVQ